MKKQLLGNTSVEVSALALGTDLIGSRIDPSTSFTLFDYFYENGGTLIDTAAMYACWLPGCKGGEAETTIGRWLKDRGVRQQMVLSSKLAFDYPGCPGGLTAQQIQTECEKSLQRLGTDHLDIYYAHRDDRETPLEETMAAFDRLIGEGKVRAIGASNLALWRIAEANSVSRAGHLAEYAAIQQRYTYLRPRHGADFGPQIFLSDEVKDYGRAHGTTLVGYSVLLQGAYVRADKPMPMQFAGPDSEQRLAVLQAVAREAGCTPPQAIIAWMRQSSPAVLPIIAGSKVEQLRENMEALGVTLSDEQMARLDAAGGPDAGQGWIQPS